MNRRQRLAGAAAATHPKSLKITGIETDLLRRPSGAPISDTIHQLGVEQGSVVLRIRTDAGITGCASNSFGRMLGGPRVFQAIQRFKVG